MSNNWTPVKALLDWASQRPDDRFLVQPRDGKVTEYTWRQTCNQARRLAGFLTQQAYPPGSRIAIISRNCAESLITDLAVWMAGHISVQIYPSLNADTLRYILDHSDTQCLFLGAVEDWGDMQHGVPKSVPVIRFPGAPFENLSQEYQSLVDVVAAAQPLEDVAQPRPEDTARLIYTSGSTGKPKGVVVPFAAMDAAKDALVEISNATQADRLISYLPFAHAFESAFEHNSSLRVGCQVFFSEGLATFPADLRRASPTIFHSVPRLWIKFQQAVQNKLSEEKLQSLLADPDTAEPTRLQVLQQLGLQDTRIALSGSAPLAGSVIQWYRDLGLELLEGYGMTEDFAYSHITRPGEVRVGYVGRPLPGVESRISEEGEIQIRSPGKMAGYYLNDDVTRESFTDDGWFRTGDLGEFDDHGRLRISGRLKELFKTSKGKYVAPAPIENQLGHPLIESLCVSGANQTQPCVMMVPNGAAIEELGDKFDKNQLEAEIAQQIENVNAGLDPHERLAFAVLVAEPWSVVNGMLTPTLKLKRNVIEAHYSDHLDKWYQQGKAVIWE